MAAVDTRRDLILEGPPGTSKTTLLRAITHSWGIPLVLVEGSAELTPGRLLGHHDPARVLSEGYTADTFEPGSLVQAMQMGGFLYFEEINRAPEDTLNVLLGAIADREVAIPRLGLVQAQPTFRLVGSMNPFDNVGTTRLSLSIRDRLCRLAITYQDEPAERGVVELRGGADTGSSLQARMVRDAVAVTRLTRNHDAIRQGSSVRGAIDLFVLVRELAAVHALTTAQDEHYPTVFRSAMFVALSGRVVLDEAVAVDPVPVLTEIWAQHFSLDPASAQPG